MIFLYLLDNDTSYMILLSSGIGVLIEYWKLTRAFDVRLGSVREEGAWAPEEAGGVDTDVGGVVLSEPKSSRTELTKIGGMSLPVAGMLQRACCITSLFNYVFTASIMEIVERLHIE